MIVPASIKPWLDAADWALDRSNDAASNEQSRRPLGKGLRAALLHSAAAVGKRMEKERVGNSACPEWQCLGTGRTKSLLHIHGG